MRKYIKKIHLYYLYLAYIHNSVIELCVVIAEKSHNNSYLCLNSTKKKYNQIQKYAIFFFYDFKNHLITQFGFFEDRVSLLHP